MFIGQQSQCLHGVNAKVRKYVSVRLQHTDVWPDLLSQLNKATSATAFKLLEYSRLQKMNARNGHWSLKPTRWGSFTCSNNKCCQRIKSINPLTPTVAIWVWPDWVRPSFVIFDIRTLWRSALSVRVSILCWSSTGCFIKAVNIWQLWVSRG